MDKSSATLVLLLLVSSLVSTLFICTGIYIIKQPQLHIIWLYSSSHPILVLNLIILLIIVSSRCFAISRHTSPAHHPDDRDQLLLPDDLTQRIIPLSSSSQAETRTSKTKKQGTLKSTWNTTKEGGHLRQLKHSHLTTQDIIRPPEMLTDPRNDEVMSSTTSSLSSAKLRREVSLTKEEVNRRVERFIRKFNDD